MWVSKEYTYEYGKSTKGKVLVNKKGQINKKNFEAYKQRLIDEAREKGASPAKVRTLQSELEDYVKDRSIHKQRLTTTGFEGHMEYYNNMSTGENKIKSYFANFGTDVETEAEILGINPIDILNEANWSNGLLTIGSAVYELQHTYRLGALKRVR